MKRAELEKLKGRTIAGRNRPGAHARYGTDSGLPSRRERRELDQAKGLVPFAVKLDTELVTRLHALARERGSDINALVGELLKKALSG